MTRGADQIAPLWANHTTPLTSPNDYPLSLLFSQASEGHKGLCCICFGLPGYLVFRKKHCDHWSFVVHLFRRDWAREKRIVWETMTGKERIYREGSGDWLSGWVYYSHVGDLYGHGSDTDLLTSWQKLKCPDSNSSSISVFNTLAARLVLS